MSRRSAELEARYDRLLRSHGRALERVAGTFEADPSKRDDLFQEICLAVWRALPRFRGESSERTFVFRIAHNRGLSHASRQLRRGRLEGDSLDELLPSGRGTALADPRHDPEASALARDRRRILAAAIRALPLAARQVLTLDLEGLPHREIAEVLGISEGNVAVRLHRARHALRERLARTPGARTPGSATAQRAGEREVER